MGIYRIKYWSTIFFSISLLAKIFTFLIYAEAYLEFSQTSKMKLFANITVGIKLLTILWNSSTLDGCLGSKFDSEVCSSHVLLNKVD